MPNNQKKINEFTVGEKVYGTFLVKSIKRGLTVQKKEYLDIELGDCTGSVTGKLWDINYEAEQLVEGDICYATGDVTEWQGNMQLRVDYIEKEKRVLDVKDYIEAAPLSIEVMDNHFHAYIEAMEEKEIQAVVREIYDANKEEFLIAPAARGMHHAIYSGLAYHTYCMLETANNLLNVYSFLNKDLLFAGVILHDMAKTKEMIYSLGNATDYTRGGHLLGHIVQGTLMVEQAATKLGTSERTKEVLQHMIVSHHGQADWGSPQPPKMPEAILLHFIDNIDAKMYMAKELMDNKGEGEYTEYHKGLRQKLLIF